MEKLSERFSELVVQKMLKCPFVEGVQEFLHEYSKKSSVYIASGIPQEELALLVRERGLLEYFKGIYGTPANKPEILQDIVDMENVRKDEIVYVGDAISDYDDARAAGVPFIARIKGSDDPNPFLELKVHVIHDFFELKACIECGDML